MHLSIIIPTGGRSRRMLAAAIESSLAQQIPSHLEWEIVVVDNTPRGSLMYAVAARNCHRLRWVHAPAPGVAEARNVGVRAARGLYIAFLDDDETAPPTWAAVLLAHAHAGAEAVFGPVEASLEIDGSHAEVARRVYSRELDAADGADITPARAYLGTGNSLFEKAACLSAPEPFSTCMNGLGGEDSVFLAGLEERGIRFTWAAHARVLEHVPADRMTLGSLALRHFRNGQIRSLVCFRTDSPIDGAAWMVIGLAQAGLYALVALVFALFQPARAAAALFKACGGLGKLFWMPPFWAVTYKPGSSTEVSMTTPAPSTDSDAPLISIIVVSYRTREMTLECLRSVVRETQHASYELIVVDNNSGDGSAEAIAAEFPQVSLIALNENVGFAQGNNIAAREATGSYLLLLNPDTIVLDGAIDRLVAFAQSRPEAGIWGGRTLYADRSLNPTSCWRRMTLWNVFCRTSGLAALLPQSPLFNSEGYGGWDRSTIRQVDIVTGCFLLTERALWEDLDGFDSKFFMYGEEADLCLRAAEVGARPVVTPHATIVHYGGASEQAETEKTIRLLAAKAELIKRHWRQPARSIGLALFALWPLTRAVASGIGAIRGASHRARALTWWRVWQRRSSWRIGYR